MKKNIILILGVVGTMLSGCESFIDTYPYGSMNDDDMWKQQAYVQGLVGYAYEQNIMPRDYRNLLGNRLDCMTDDGVMTDPNSTESKFANGVLPSSSDPFASYWKSYYNVISNLNLFLKDDRGYNTRYFTNKQKNDIYRKVLQGEAYALRAYMYSQLLKRWGGIGAESGKLLGVPLILEPLTPDMDMNFERATYDECVAQIVSDANKAYELLPIANRDYIEENKVDLTMLGAIRMGRIDGITTRAILADVYLTYASELFNPNNDTDRWKLAAKYAKEVIDFKMNVDNVSGGFEVYKYLDWTNPYDPASVFFSRRSGNTDSNDSQERDQYPKGFLGDGVFGPTQDLVDCFPDENGYPITHQSSVYDKNNPYEKRDLRFYDVFFYNGLTIKPASQEYTFECWEEAADGTMGKDAPLLQNVSRTGYHLKKMVYMNLDWREPSNIQKKAPRVKHYYRWAHMVLAYAEAMNELFGPEGTEGDLNISAKDAMKMLRNRNTYSNIVSPYMSADPYLDEVANEGPAEFKEFIYNERRIETCFEGLRYFDIRRWNTSVDKINKPVHKVTITKNQDGTFVYDFTKVVENRSFPSLFTPIPLDEMKRNNAMEQNKGWESWK